MDDAPICQLTAAEAVDPRRTGGKGANLAVLVRAGLPVPPGFVVTTAAYREFVSQHSLDTLIGKEMAALGGDPDAVDVISRRLRQAFEAAPMSTRLRELITQAHNDFGSEPMAVRSSATAEDLPGASFAGQQDTILNVHGAEALCDAVRRCWSSLWTARAIAYRRDHDIGDIGHEDVAVAVVVQPMVAAEVAGVLFTADPLSGRRDRFVIEAAAGLGEAVVSGSTSPDRWVVDACGRAVLSGPERPLLTPAQLDALVDLGSRCAAIFGVPQDLEWAVREEKIWLLQSRPITSLFPVPPVTGPGLRVYIPVMLVAQGIAEPMTPAGNAFFRAMVTGWFRYWISGQRPREVDGSPEWLPIVAHRIFVDVTPLLQRPRLASRLVANFRLKDPDGSAALRNWLTQNGSRLAPARGVTLPRGLTVWVTTLLSGVIASLVAPARTRHRLITNADDVLARLTQRADALSSPPEQLHFVDHVLPAATCEMLLRQLAPAYGEWLIRIMIERLVRRWLGLSAGFDPVLRWLPHDPTIAMGAALARLATDHAAAGIEPTPTSPGVAGFLDEFGHRAPDREVDLGLPRLADDPTYVVELIEGYQRSDALRTFEAGAEQARTAAAALVSDVRETKGGLRAAVLQNLLNRHRELGGLRERPKFDMVRAIALGRRTLQRCAATLLARDLLDDADDIFFIDPADLRNAVTGHETNLRACALANRQAFKRELGRRLVPRVLTSDGEVVYGAVAAPPAGTAGVLIGTPLSPGVHEGVVRVLDSPVGARVQPGEVLVAASTDPGWTPLFLLAGALVMEVGGVVSHGALVAREYGIPAVAGIPDAMAQLHTGQRVRVDGSAGTVTILEPIADAAVA